MLTHTSQLTTEQLAELEALCADCKHTDGNIISLYNHILSQNRSIACNVFYHQKNQLVGFLSTFFFYEDACEVAVLVAPTYRKQGIARQMIKANLPLIAAQGIKTLIFSSPNGLNTPWLPAQGFSYEHSEYQMQRRSIDPILSGNHSLMVRAAILADIPAFCTIDEACFSSPQPDMDRRVHHLLNDPEYKLFVAEIDGIPVGKAHIHCQKEGARFTDIAILPHLQGRGFGSELLAHCINYCRAIHLEKISLDVETNNQHALNLYLRLGFAVINSCDFWTIPLQSLQL